MTDRAKVIHGLELVKEDISEKFTSGSQIAVDYLRIDKAIAMLKDPEAELQKGRYYSDVFDIGYKAGKESIVRCRDCKYNDDGECIIKAGWFPVKPDWFCAEGERRVIT